MTEQPYETYRDSDRLQKNVVCSESMILTEIMWHQQSIMDFLHYSIVGRKAVESLSATQRDRKAWSGFVKEWD